MFQIRIRITKYQPSVFFGPFTFDCSRRVWSSRWTSNIRYWIIVIWRHLCGLCIYHASSWNRTLGEHTTIDLSLLSEFCTVESQNVDYVTYIDINSTVFLIFVCLSVCMYRYNWRSTWPILTKLHKQRKCVNGCIYPLN